MRHVPGILGFAWLSISESPGSPPFFQGLQEGGQSHRARAVKLLCQSSEEIAELRQNKVARALDRLLRRLL